MMEWKDALKNNKRWKEGKEVEKKEGIEERIMEMHKIIVKWEWK